MPAKTTTTTTTDGAVQRCSARENEATTEGERKRERGERERRWLWSPWRWRRCNGSVRGGEVETRRRYTTPLEVNAAIRFRGQPLGARLKTRPSCLLACRPTAASSITTFSDPRVSPGFVLRVARGRAAPCIFSGASGVRKKRGCKKKENAPAAPETISETPLVCARGTDYVEREIS